jgi:transcriptional regulator with XRE-family HTH domain
MFEYDLFVLYICVKVVKPCLNYTFMALISFGDRLYEVRKNKKISQADLAKKIGVHGAVIGRYERNEVKPSIEIASQIAKALDISLDYLVGNSDLILDNTLISRVQNIQQLDNENKNHLFALMDAFLRDFKAKKAYAS